MRARMPGKQNFSIRSGLFPVSIPQTVFYSKNQIDGAMLCIARTASCSPFTPASVQRNQLAVSGENPRLTAYSVPGQCICLIVADKNIVVRFRGLEGFRSKLPLVEESMRPASPMVRRKRDFFEWEFTKKMNAVGL